MKKGLTIIIATKDRFEMLNNCVSSLISNYAGNINFEIVVMDQSDSEISFKETNNIKYIKTDFVGKTKALNKAVGDAIYEYIGVIDDDCLVESDWISKMFVEIDNLKSKHIITGKVVAGEIECNSEKTVLDDSLDKETFFLKKIITPIFILSGCNFGFKRKDFFKIGKFDESFGPGSRHKSSDDNEWCYRALHDYNFTLKYSPDLRVVHRSWRDEKEQSNQFSDYGWASGTFFAYMLEKSVLDFTTHFFKLLYWTAKVLTIGTKKQKKWQKLYVSNFMRGFKNYGK